MSTFTAGQTLTAAQLNALFDSALSAWTAYAPTVTGFTVGNGTIAGRYIQVGKTVQVHLSFVAGTTSTYSSTFGVTLPVTPHGSASQATGDFAVGTARCIQAGSKRYVGVAGSDASGNVTVMVANGTGVGTFLGLNAPNAWVAGDFFDISMTYEAA